MRISVENDAIIAIKPLLFIRHYAQKAVDNRQENHTISIHKKNSKK